MFDLLSQYLGLTFAAKMTSQGTRQGHLILYSVDSYPEKAIGPVTYLWRAQFQDKDSECASRVETLWISCHPSIFQGVMSEIKKCFGSKETESPQDHPVNNTVDAKDESKVSITSLKDQLVKFRLFGPASNLVLAETLKLADVVGNHASIVPASAREVSEESPKN